MYDLNEGVARLFEEVRGVAWVGVDYLTRLFGGLKIVVAVLEFHLDVEFARAIPLAFVAVAHCEVEFHARHGRVTMQDRRQSDCDKPINVSAQVLVKCEVRYAILGHCEHPAESHICVSKRHIDVGIFTRLGVETFRVLAGG